VDNHPLNVLQGITHVDIQVRKVIAMAVHRGGNDNLHRRMTLLAETDQLVFTRANFCQRENTKVDRRFRGSFLIKRISRIARQRFELFQKARRDLCIHAFGSDEEQTLDVFDQRVLYRRGRAQFRQNIEQARLSAGARPIVGQPVCELPLVCDGGTLDHALDFRITRSAA
jgi:hypothetical protein